MVLNEPLPGEVHDLIARRRALGLDTHDEVWNGEYHMNPAPHPDHGHLEAGLHRILGLRALDRELFPSGPVNIGTADDYRVPDLAFFRERPSTVFVSGAAVVVEVLSPHDEAWQKFDHYRTFGVEEILVADRSSRRCRWFVRSADGFVEATESEVLGVTGAVLSDELDW